MAAVDADHYVGARMLDRIAAEYLPQIDAEVAALGHSSAARNAILGP